MTRDKTTPPSKYTCNEYREEMILLALKQRRLHPDLDDVEKEKLIKEIERLEKKIGF